MAKVEKFQKSADGFERYIGHRVRVLFKGNAIEGVLISDGVYNIVVEGYIAGRKMRCVVEKMLPILILGPGGTTYEEGEFKASHYKDMKDREVKVISVAGTYDGYLREVYPHAVHVETKEGVVIFPTRSILAICTPA